MHILFLEWNSYCNEDFIFYLKAGGHHVTVYPFAVNDNPRRNQAVTASLYDHIHCRKYDFLFSFNYYPTAAYAAYRANVKYVSWTYDSPYVLLYSHSIGLPTNYVFIFDKAACQDLWNLGLQNIFYLPMAANTMRYGNMPQINSRLQKYQSDISFVGSMYVEKKHSHFQNIEGLSPYCSGYRDSLIQAQKNIYGTFLLDKLMPEPILEELTRCSKAVAAEDGYETIEWVIANYFLARQVTALERKELLQGIDMHFPSALKIYTFEETPFLPNSKNMGKVDYYTQMPYIFQNSKINLNITLKSIHTGIPLRAMDILGCGGFLLSNYQEDFLDYFDPGIDFVFYESIEDCMNKISYFLSHEKERAEIAQNGQNKMKAFHTYPARINEIIEVISSSEH